jgi:hypothetical protein
MNRFFIYLITLFIPVFSFSNNFDFDDDYAPSSKKEKFYINFKGGFSIPASKSTIGSPREEIGREVSFIRGTNGNNITEQSVTNPFGSRGAGVTIAASFGYMFNENFGVEMELSFLRSTRILNASRDIDTTGLRFYAEHTSYTTMYRAAPMLVVMGNKNMKVRPYAKFGLLLPFAGATHSSLNYEDNTGILSERLLPILNENLYQNFLNLQDSLGIKLPIPTRSNIDAQTLGSFSLGFASRFGAEIKLNDKLSIFGEMEVNMLTIKAKKTIVKSFNSRVSDPALVSLAESFLGEFKSEYTLSDLPEIVKITNYVNEITERSNYSYDINSPSFNRNTPYEQLTFRDNYNSFGILVGIKYSF